ncbi:MAG: aspartate dehydrogenase [Mogibacterium sp.]|nr:aspartate dehydrogenase [Mogibacterium sp.]
MSMGLFGKKKNLVPLIDRSRGEAVLRCSICSGEQVLCFEEAGTGELRELMLVRSQADIDDFCRANGLSASDIRKVY